MTHLEHSGKDFDTPDPPAQPPPQPLPLAATSSFFLITHYPVPVSGRECREHLQVARPEPMRWTLFQQNPTRHCAEQSKKKNTEGILLPVVPSGDESGQVISGQ